MRKKSVVMILAVVALAAFGGQALVQADENGAAVGPQPGPGVLGPIGGDIGGKWLEFSFTTVGVDAKGCSPADPGGLGCVASSGGNSKFLDAPPWTFTAPASGAVLTVTDAFLIGDRFELFDAAVSKGTTSVPGTSGSCGGDGSNPEICLTTAGISHGTFSLAPGAHSLTIKATASPFGSGAAYFRVDVRCDADGDGDVDIKDAIAVLKFLLQGTALTGRGADCNGDGKVNFLDVLAILQHI